MKFQVVNEFFHFSLSDRVLTGTEWSPTDIQLTLGALIVLPENSRNINFTKSYAGPVQLRLIGGQLIDSVKEGYLHRDVNGKLPESAPDTVLSPAEVEALLSTFHDVYLFQILSETREGGSVLPELGIEFPQAGEFDTLVTPSYRIDIRCEKVVFDWNYYMNRVES